MIGECCKALVLSKRAGTTYSALLPLTAPASTLRDVLIVVRSSRDPLLVGRRFRVGDALGGTFVVVRKVPLQAIVNAGQCEEMREQAVVDAELGGGTPGGTRTVDGLLRPQPPPLLLVERMSTPRGRLRRTPALRTRQPVDTRTQRS
ncbi:DUF6093 family protein [Streptomyces sp. NPDC050095]|uniref:DUF6093 family protein n=1 Tax=unclassified Streptomyces TaxID=2593676 RepID=UPI00342084CC